MAFSRACGWLMLLVLIPLTMNSDAFPVGITFVENAVQKGAVCLDGSPPAYHLSRGFGAGINNWVLNFEGGAWCNNVTTCLKRRDTRLGSSKKMNKELSFSGMLSNNENVNPDFHNWNKVKVRYCDGSSFTGDVEQVDPATKLHFRGARVFRAIIDDLMAKGMRNAENVLLAGCSAGGLASILQCDNFHTLMPVKAKVKCLSDAGYFVDAKDISGTERIKAFYDEVVTTHGSAKNLPSYCTSRMKPGLCFFPQNVVQQMETPLFILNAAYDSWQIKNILAPGVADPHGKWHDCKKDIKKCSDSQLKIMQDYRLQFLKALDGVEKLPDTGMFVNSCYAHCQSGMGATWSQSGSPILNKTTIAKAVGDWYFDRNSFKKIDCPYPCDSSCHNRVFDVPDSENIHPVGIYSHTQ